MWLSFSSKLCLFGFPLNFCLFPFPKYPRGTEDQFFFIRASSRWKRSDQKRGKFLVCLHFMFILMHYEYIFSKAIACNTFQIRAVLVYINMLNNPLSIVINFNTRPKTIKFSVYVVIHIYAWSYIWICNFLWPCTWVRSSQHKT